MTFPYCCWFLLFSQATYVCYSCTAIEASHREQQNGQQGPVQDTGVSSLVLAVMGSELGGVCSSGLKSTPKKPPSRMVCSSGVSLYGWLAVAACSEAEQ